MSLDSFSSCQCQNCCAALDEFMSSFPYRSCLQCTFEPFVYVANILNRNPCFQLLVFSSRRPSSRTFGICRSCDFLEITNIVLTLVYHVYCYYSESCVCCAWSCFTQLFDICFLKNSESTAQPLTRQSSVSAEVSYL